MGDSGFKDHFSRLAAQYSTFRPTYPASLFGYLAGLCPGRRSAWDCACGSGQATVALAGYFDSVTGTDASPQQVAAATPHPRIRYHVASAERSGIEPRSMDLVTVAQALHWLDLEAFYREVKRVLRDTGVIAVWTYGVLHVHGDGIDALEQEFYRDIVGPYWPPERRIVESAYRDLAFPFEELTPPPFQMEESWNLARLTGYMRTWSATARYVEENRVDPVESLERRLAPLWGNPKTERTVSWPLGLRVGRMK